MLYVRNLKHIIWNFIYIWFRWFHWHHWIRLTHWGRVTHICVSKLTIIGSDNCLSPDRHQAIIWTNAGLLSIGPLRIYFSENLIKIQQFSLKKMHVKMSSGKWRPFCLGFNVLRALFFPYQQPVSAGENTETEISLWWHFRLCESPWSGIQHRSHHIHCVDRSLWNVGLLVVTAIY